MPRWRIGIGDMAHIFQEGLRIPPVKILERGAVCQDGLDLILLNCQVAHEVYGLDEGEKPT